MSNSRETGQEKYTFPDRIQNGVKNGYTEEKKRTCSGNNNYGYVLYNTVAYFNSDKSCIRQKCRE